MPAKLAIVPFAHDQQQILFWNRRVGYCGDKPGMPVNFLTDSRDQCGLTQQERIEVLQYVTDHVGTIKHSKKLGELLKHVREPETIDDSGDPVDRGQADEDGALS